MPDNHRKRVPPFPPDHPPPSLTPPPSLLLFQCMIQPRDFQCDFLEKVLFGFQSQNLLGIY